ncbi:hypothetical protein PPS11_10318 [Pseudomonas putida S11]|nr:hypothetical protein PPS11_10318 [Pseudomonas putida S11]
MVRLAPLPQANDLAGQYRSQPQQMRSGWLGFVGNFLGMVSFPQDYVPNLYLGPLLSLIDINIQMDHSRAFIPDPDICLTDIWIRNNLKAPWYAETTRCE